MKLKIKRNLDFMKFGLFI